MIFGGVAQSLLRACVPMAMTLMATPFGLLRGGIAAFFGWWLGELASLMPRRLRPTAGRRRRGLVLALGADEIVVAEGAADGLRTLGSVDAAAPDRDERLRALLRQAKRRGRRPATVRLAPALGLRKTLELPLAARDDLDQLLRFEMDRLTPFRAEEVHFAQQVLATDAAGRRLTVELQAAPRRVVEEALATARELGLRPARVELAADDAGGAEPLNLLGDQPGGGARESRVNRALVLLALLLLVIAVAIPLRRQQARLAELENQVAAARAEAEDSLALREQLDQLTRSASFLVGEKTSRPMVTEVVAELTRLVPDQAHIVQLELRDGSVQLHGYAATASDLIGLLDQSALFKTPQFRSPVTQDPRTGLERFHLSVELLGAGES
jgi:general secretion pathway protein L